MRLDEKIICRLLGRAVYSLIPVEEAGPLARDPALIN